MACGSAEPRATALGDTSTAPGMPAVCHTAGRPRYRYAEGAVPQRLGGVPEWLNGAVSKTVVGRLVDRGFESHPLRYGSRNTRQEQGAICFR